MLTCTLAMAQQRDVSGRVVSEKGEAIPFASVKIKGQKTGVTADEVGIYRIKAKAGDILEISSQGTSVDVIVGNASVPPAVLTVVSKKGNEITVVATALGKVAQPKELGYSIARVGSKELTATKNINLQQGLTGKVSGLTIQTTNSGVFGDTRILLRGIRSLTGNNQPLLVIDGVPINLNFINSINPEDIQDVTILKGASGAAIYGPDGVNGVIILTTKRGNRGKPSVTVSETVQLERVAFFPRLQTRFGSGSSEDPATGRGVYDPIENQCYGDEFDGSIRQIGRDAPDGSKYLIPYTSNPGEKLKYWNTGVTTQHNISLNAGTDNSRFYLSIQDANTKGVTPGEVGDIRRRTTLRLNAEHTYNALTAGFNIAYVRNAYDVTTNDGFWELLNTPMHIPITQFKDWRNNYWASPDGFFSDYFPNPYWGNDNERAVGRGDQIVGDLNLKLKLKPWLTAVYRLGTTVDFNSSKNSTGPRVYTPFARNQGKFIATDRPGSVSDGQSWANRLNSEFILSASRTFNKVKMDVTLGNQVRQSQSKSISVSGNNLVVPNLFNVANRTGEPGAAEGNSKSRIISAFGKVAFGYNDWAYLELTGRNDWDSRLAKANRSFFYPGASASLVLSEAIPSLKESSSLSLFKVRGAYSKSGNVNIGVYGLLPTYGNAGGFPYGTLPGITANNTIPDENILPEFVLSKELGVEFGFLKNKVIFEATVYQQDNSNQVLNVGLSPATGYTTTIANAGAFINKGFEIDLKLTPIIKLNNGLNIDLKFNYALNDNKVNEVYRGLDEINIGNANFIIKGSPAYTFKLSDYLRDNQGRVIVDAVTGLPSADPSPKKFGRTLPKHTFGANTTINYKNFSFAVTADYRGGHEVFHGIGPSMDFTGISYRSGQNGRQRFVFPNSVIADPANAGKYIPNTNITVLSGGYGFWEQTAPNRSINTNYLTSAASWKLREVSLSYEFSPAGLSKLGKSIKGASLGITGRNLFMWLPKSNQWLDPEFSNTVGNAQGVYDEDDSPPPTRTMGINLTIRF
jgi:TonB-linked SusC/RagA family outer membrane protein